MRDASKDFEAELIRIQREASEKKKVLQKIRDRIEKLGEPHSRNLEALKAAKNKANPSSK